MAEETKRKIRKYFTQADVEAGLCDKNGLPLPGGPTEPPKREIPDSKPSEAQKALNPGLASGNTAAPAPNTTAAPQQPKDLSHPEPGKEAVDPLSLDPKPAEEGMNVPGAEAA